MLLVLTKRKVGLGDEIVGLEVISQVIRMKILYRKIPVSVFILRESIS